MQKRLCLIQAAVLMIQVMLIVWNVFSSATQDIPQTPAHRLLLSDRGPSDPCPKSGDPPPPDTVLFFRRDFKRLLDHIYTQGGRALSGFKASRADREEVVKLAGNGTGVYGEILPDTLTMMMKKLKKLEPLRKEWKFIDLGSGMGKAVIQFALEHGTEARGVELSQHRCHGAQAALEKLDGFVKRKKTSYEQLGVKRPYLTCGDVRDYDHYGDSNVVFIDSLTWPKVLKHKVGENLLKQFRKIDETLYIITAGSDHPLKKVYPKIKQETFSCPMSWMDDLTCWLHTFKKEEFDDDLLLVAPGPENAVES